MRKLLSREFIVDRLFKDKAIKNEYSNIVIVPQLVEFINQYRPELVGDESLITNFTYEPMYEFDLTIDGEQQVIVSTIANLLDKLIEKYPGCSLHPTGNGTVDVNQNGEIVNTVKIYKYLNLTIITATVYTAE